MTKRRILTFVLLLTAPPAFAQPTSQPTSRNSFIRRLTRVLVPGDLMSLQQVRESGRSRAEKDYRAGVPQIEVFGLVLCESNVDMETGLYIKQRGCVAHSNEAEESRAYNERVRELVRKKGIPPNLRDLKARFEKAKSIDDRPPPVDWKKIPITAESDELKYTPVGLVQVARRKIRLPGWKGKDGFEIPPQDHSQIVIKQDDEGIGAVLTSSDAGVEVAYWKDIDLLIIREKHQLGEYSVFDVRMKRIMWRSFPGIKKLKECIDQPKKAVDQISLGIDRNGSNSCAISADYVLLGRGP